MKARKQTGCTYDGDLEDLWYSFFAAQASQDKSRLDLCAATLDPGTSYFILGGRNSIIKALKANGTNRITTSDGSNLSLSFKVNITRKGQMAKKIAANMKQVALTPFAIVGLPVLMWVKRKDTAFMNNADIVASCAAASINNAQTQISYDSKTCAIVQIFNASLGGVAMPKPDYPLMNSDVTMSTLGTLLDNLMPK